MKRGGFFSYVPTLSVLCTVNGLWLVFGLMAGEAAAEQSTPGIPLRLAKESLFDPKTLVTLCARLKPACNPATTKAYVRRKNPDGFVYLIDGSKPMLIRLNKQDKQHAHMSWDFSDYIHTYKNKKILRLPDDDWFDPPVIYPAHYQVDAHQFAIALIQTKHFMYSGGGGINQSADFLALDTSSTSPGLFGFKPLYQGVPFSSGALIRACFTEKDYADWDRHLRRDCHDDKTAYLTLAFNNSIRANGPWHFIWHYSFQSSVHAKQDVLRHTRFYINDDESAETKRDRLSLFFVNQ